MAIQLESFELEIDCRTSQVSHYCWGSNLKSIAEQQDDFRTLIRLPLWSEVKNLWLREETLHLL